MRTEEGSEKERVMPGTESGSSAIRVRAEQSRALIV